MIGEKRGYGEELNKRGGRGEVEGRLRGGIGEGERGRERERRGEGEGRRRDSERERERG